MASGDKTRQQFIDWMKAQDTDPDKPAIPAATVVIMRDAEPTPQVLMMKRNSKITFGGMWVFPGGRVDPEDYPADAPDDVFEASRHAAVRETHEEANLTVAAESLVRYSHWIPPSIAPKRFSTWFFFAPVSPDSDVVIDDGEIKEHDWWTPADALARQTAGEIELAPPTWVTLYWLDRYFSDHGSLDGALAAADADDIFFYATRAVRDGDTAVAMWTGDAAYDGGALDTPGGRHRLEMRPDGWVFSHP